MPPFNNPFAGHDGEDAPALEPRIFSVTQINEAISNALKRDFSRIYVEGEISGWKVAASGHAYFSLKDEKSLIKAVMWKSGLAKARVQPADGQLVKVYGSLTVYAPRGEYQIDVTGISQAGVGLLAKKFEELKAKLSSEGLFEDARKRMLPDRIRKAVVITSPTGAAVRDFLRTLKNHDTGVDVLILPVLVQGVEAPPMILKAIQMAPRFSPDVVVLIRGGGSLEDLWAFNDETVARAIANCPVPVISGIGHEVDFTIADFVADLRASTPTGAAVMIASQFQKLRDAVDDMDELLGAAMRDAILEVRRDIKLLERRLRSRSPISFLPFYRQRVDELLSRAQRQLANQLREEHGGLALLGSRMKNAMALDLTRWKGQLERESKRLDILDPAATLNRGYALCESALDGAPVRRLEDLPADGEVRVHLSDGHFKARPII